ncbi:hypothetical protein CI109_105980 [Kwoniella shandongensis]|uniref:Mob1/phocein n=1 Tax=Kwoniella shandongensis TaxID=1734106 RepID=A0AAJ8LQT4_9TREE
MIIPSVSQQAEGSSYRLKRGTKLADIPTPAVPSLSSLNGPFQLAEYLALKIRHDPHDVKGLVEIPTGDGSVGGKAPERDVWIYEHLRRIPIDLTPFLTSLLPICTRESCPQMKADEWLYLCVAHGGGGTEECCAVDYILHTVDSTTALLNSSKNFPSRMQIPSASLTHFPSLFRRLSRIFSHAYFHHREAFSLAESETSLYARFVGLCERYDLVGPGLLVIPREVVGQFSSNSADEEDEEEEDEEEDDEDEDEDEADEGDSDEEDGDADVTRRGRGEEESAGTKGEKRPHSLDRHPYPQSTASSSTNEDSGLGTSIASAAGAGMTIGRGTLGRGKQPRATMVWGGAADAPALPESQGEEEEAADDTAARTRARSESIESAVHIPSLDKTEVPDEALEALEASIPAAVPEEEAEDDVQGSEEPTASEGEEIVPKDEIELLEEQGKLDPAPPVAPLATAADPETKDVATSPASAEQEEEGDGLEEVKLDEDEKTPIVMDKVESVTEEKESSPVKEKTSSPVGKKSEGTSPKKETSPSKNKKSHNKKKGVSPKGKGKSSGTPVKVQADKQTTEPPSGEGKKEKEKEDEVKAKSE